MRVSSPRRRADARRAIAGDDRDDPGATVGVAETVREQPRCAEGADRARPVHRGSGIQHRVVDARVVGDARPLTPGAARRTPRVRRPSRCPARRAGARARPRIHSSSRTPSGGVSARRRRMTRPSRFVIVPSSSAHWGTGRTTSARAAVSERKKSDTTSRSSRPSRLPHAPTRSAPRRRRWIRARAAPAARPSVPSACSSSTAGMPAPGMTAGSTPHTAATCARASGSVIFRYPGSWSHFWPCSRPP